jgi:DNA repair photolyase
MEASPHSGPTGPRGRGASGNPENRFTRLSIESEEPPPDRVETVFYTDTTRGILARNDSPDVGFSVSLNPYRGCEHGCIYCFARPTHEYLGLSAGLDFETRIFVKEDAPELLRAELLKRSYKPEVIAISGVTDPYQPVERRLEITRRCLEVLAEFRNPVAIITKNALVARDVDHLASLAEHQAALVCISITTLDPEIARVMEPRASHPRDRLAALAQLSAAGVPCAVLAAPMVPGLTDHELPAILAAAAEAGARSAHFIPIRLPGAVAGLFEQWLEEHFPDRKDKVLNRIRDLRGGALYEAEWGVRGRGRGIFAQQIESIFDVTCRRLGLNEREWKLSAASFRRRTAQGTLFD